MQKNILPPEISTEKCTVCRKSNLLLAGTELFANKANITRYFGVPGEPLNDSGVLCYYLAGTGSYELADGTETLFSPGLLVFWKHSNFRIRQHHDPGIYLEKYLLFPNEIYAVLEKFNLSRENYLKLDIGTVPETAREFDRLCRELAEQQEIKLPQTALHMFEFILKQTMYPPSTSRKQISLMEKAAELLDADFSKPVSMQEIAGKLHLGYSSFRHLFTDFYSVSPAEYRIRRKIEKIQQLLCSGKYTVKELSVEFGYANPYVLSKQFKKYTGVSPKEYRSRNTNTLNKRYPFNTADSAGAYAPAESAVVHSARIISGQRCGL